MATRIPARLSAAEGRQFGLTVGAAFAALSAVSWWRGHHTSSLVLGSLGLGLVTLGVVIPDRLGPVQRAWMGLAHLLSKITTPVFMGIVYFGVITPIGLLRRAFGKNALVRPVTDGGYWVSRAGDAARRSTMEHQF